MNNEQLLKYKAGDIVSLAKNNKGREFLTLNGKPYNGDNMLVMESYIEDEKNFAKILHNGILFNIREHMLKKTNKL